MPWVGGRELRKLPTTKAVDTKLVSRPRIHVETTQGTAKGGGGKGGGLTVCPSNGSFGG